jgi:4,5-dihydroxyphthalate decarboxylase
MHGTIVVKESVLKEHPWVAGSIAAAFQAAKSEWLPRFRSGAADTAADRKYLALSKIVGSDPLPYGLEVNLPTIRALEDTAFKQKLTPRRMTIEELFVDPK